MNDEPHTGTEASSGNPSGAPSRKPRQKLWRRFIRHQLRKTHQRKAEREKKRSEEKPEERAARKTADATVWIAIFTVVLAAASILTLVEVIVGGSDTHDLAVQAKRQADKMKDMSDAADKIRQAAENMVTQDQRIAENAEKSFKASNKQSRDALDATIASSHLDQRAWITTERAGILFKPNQPAVSEFFLHNTGKTPARNFKAISWLEILNADESPTFIPPEDQFLAKMGGQFMVPNARYPVGARSRTVVTPEMVPEWVNGQIWLATIAEITYEDVFGRKHWLHICDIGFAPIENLANLPQGATTEISTPPGANKCGEYNDFDKD